MNKKHIDVFESHRPMLTAVAYQMLGERAEAQDLVQDTWEVWNSADRNNIKSPAAWLRTVIARLSIDALRSAVKQREVYVGPWLPEPLIEDVSLGPKEQFEMSKSCELALMWAMQRLSPQERSAYILRKVFDCDYSELSLVLDKSESACRQIVSRASKRIMDTNIRFGSSIQETGELLQCFAQACAANSHEQVLALLAPDVVSLSDGGGKVRAALRPLNGAAEVSKVLLSTLLKYPPSEPVQVKTVNGLPALVVAAERGEGMVCSVQADNSGRIAWIYIMRNPDKLKQGQSNSASAVCEK